MVRFSRYDKSTRVRNYSFAEKFNVEYTEFLLASKGEHEESSELYS